MKVEQYQLLDITKSALREMGISDYKDLELTYRLKVNNEWRVNFSFRRGYSGSKEIGCLAVDAETGEIRFVGLDRKWQ